MTSQAESGFLVAGSEASTILFLGSIETPVRVTPSPRWLLSIFSGPSTFPKPCGPSMIRNDAFHGAVTSLARDRHRASPWAAPTVSSVSSHLDRLHERRSHANLQLPARVRAKIDAIKNACRLAGHPELE